MRTALAAVVLSAALAGCCRRGPSLAAVPEQADTFLQNGADTITAKFTQRPAIVDILFVVDNSPSMCSKQAALEAAFSGFLDAIGQQQFDFHVGVTTTDFQNPQFQGRLVAGPSGHPILDSTMSTAQLQQYFTEDVKAVGTAGATQSQPLLAAAVALQPPLTTGANQGFLRDSASLAVIVVTDEDDYSLTLPPSNPIEDPMPHYFTRLFLGLKGPGNDGLVTVSAISGFDPTSNPPTAADCSVPAANPAGCVDGNNDGSAAARLLAVVQGTSGVAQSICQSDFATLLSNLGRLIGGLSRRFDISSAPVGQDFQASSLTVVVTPPGGQPQTIPQNDQTGWHYDASAKSVEFIGSYAPPPGAQVTITYAALQAQFKLSHQPLQSSLQVTVTPKGGTAKTVPPSSQDPIHGWTYDPPSQSVIFPPANLPPLGSTIEVDYQIQ